MITFTSTEQILNNVDAEGRYKGSTVSWSRHIVMAFADGGMVKPHPDGKSWHACCSGPGETKSSDTCQCFCRKNYNGNSRRDAMMDRSFATPKVKQALHDAVKEKARFYCVHRMTADGYHRECAGWTALYNPERLP